MNSSPITLRRASASDAAAMALLMSEPQVARQLLQLPWQSAEQWHSRLVDGQQPGQPDLLLVAERNGELVGNAGLHAPSSAVRRRHVVSLGMAVQLAAQGQGVGKTLVAALIDYADHWLPVLRIELTVFTDNAPAIALYRHFGFEVEGTHRAYALRDGVYVDALFMARLHPHPPRWA